MGCAEERQLGKAGLEKEIEWNLKGERQGKGVKNKQKRQDCAAQPKCLFSTKKVSIAEREKMGQEGVTKRSSERVGLEQGEEILFQ